LARPIELHERIDGVGLVSDAAVAHEFVDGLVRRFGADFLAVGPDAGHGIEGIDHGEVACRGRDGVAREAVGVSRAVPAFVVVADEVEDEGIGFIEAAEALPAERGVLLDDLEFIGGEFAGLKQDGVGDLDFADVVERGSVGEALQKLVIVGKPLGEGAGVEDDAPGVGGGGDVFGFEDGDERADEGGGHDKGRYEGTAIGDQGLWAGGRLKTRAMETRRG